MSDLPNMPMDVRHYPWRAALAECERPYREAMHPYWYAQRCRNDRDPPSLLHGEAGYGDSWDHGYTFDDVLACAYGRKEWRVGRSEIEKRAREQALRNVRKLPARDFAYDVEGEFFDVAAVVEGRPEQWLTPTHATVGERAAVRLVIDLSTSCGVPAKVMCERMFTVASTALTLECAGIPCETIVATMEAGTPGYCLSIQVNNAGEPLDVSRLVAAAHPAFFRRLTFRLQEITTHDDVAKAYCQGYGWVNALKPEVFQALFGPYAYLIPGLSTLTGLAPTVKALNDILTARAMPTLGR